MYHELGQFQYQLSDFTKSPIQQSVYTSDFGNALYLGQLKEGTNIRDGIGIAVYRDGDTLKLNNKVLQRDIGRIINEMEKADI